MSALVRNHPAGHDVPARPGSDSWTFGGFGPHADRIGAADRFGGALLTILLVLYPAIASVAVVIAAIMLGSGSV